VNHGPLARARSFWVRLLASKVLTGRAPTILKAIRFDPKGKQGGLKPIVVAAGTIDPMADDFYRRLSFTETS
jgi:hypothetical protein